MPSINVGQTLRGDEQNDISIVYRAAARERRSNAQPRHWVVDWREEVDGSGDGVWSGVTGINVTGGRACTVSRKLALIEVKKIVYCADSPGPPQRSTTGRHQVTLFFSKQCPSHV